MDLGRAKWTRSVEDIREKRIMSAIATESHEGWNTNADTRQPQHKDKCDVPPSQTVSGGI